MARPTLLTDELKDKLVVAAEAVYHYKFIAGLCGISLSALDDYRKDDPDLEVRLNQARNAFIKNNMRKSKPEFLLETADRETFGKKEETNTQINFIQMVLNKYGGTTEGAINEVPRPETIEERASQDPA